MTRVLLHSMKSTLINNINVLFFEHLIPFKNLFHAITTRTGGISRQPFNSLNVGLNTEDTAAAILGNHIILCSTFNIEPSSLVSCRQVHGIKVKKVTTFNAYPFPQYTFEGYDAMVTNIPDITLVVRVADCVPIILFDPEKNCLAVIHAGWKGTLKAITAETIKTMETMYDCSAINILAGIGPSIGPCCFKVSRDVADLFINDPVLHSTAIRRNGDFFINLQEANRLHLIRQGCCFRNIEVSGLCTSCNSDIFFSYRREQGKTGRFGLLAGLRS